MNLLTLLIGFQIKHYLADYVLQTRLMLKGKGHFGAPGGYLHAGVHVLGSLVVLLAAAVFDVTLLFSLLLAEFALHYLLDFAKIRYSRNVDFETDPPRYWRLHGIDQMAHQLTYVAMIAVVLSQ